MSARSVYKPFNHSVWLAIICLATVIVLGIIGHNPYRTLQLQSGRYTLQIADSDAERNAGLGGQHSLPTDKGMLFVYGAPSLQCFWMKDMHFAIDMLWLDRDKKVVHIAAGVTPETYPQTFCPPKPATYVIELRAGEAARQGVMPGDTLSF